jgi:oligoribonuclease NrnB/cAMP/cGMP phosphodiesterase (DHH superfamily)
MKPLCIYHGGCDDGFAAAWCLRKAFGGDIDFYPGIYQTEPPPHECRDVIFVDFSYKRPVLDAMAKAASSILILDHHKTAQDDLADIDPPPLTFDHRDAASIDGAGNNMFALFDMNRSGAAMAWDWFIGGDRPDFIEYVQDRDLWRKRLPNGDEFTIALRSYPQQFEIWDRLVDCGVERLIEEGRSIQRYYRLRVEELKNNAYAATLAGHPIFIANAPYFAASEVAGELAERACAFGACYFEVEGARYQYSLRSRGDFDVSAVARQFGGGGHKAAAGFSVAAPVHLR